MKNNLNRHERKGTEHLRRVALIVLLALLYKQLLPFEGRKIDGADAVHLYTDLSILTSRI